VTVEHLRDLRPDLQRRVERRHRVLEDHRDLAPAHVLELALRDDQAVAARVDKDASPEAVVRLCPVGTVARLETVEDPRFGLRAG
jgi:hypothetical protein